jgi:hypothetical protein
MNGPSASAAGLQPRCEQADDGKTGFVSNENPASGGRCALRCDEVWHKQRLCNPNAYASPTPIRFKKNRCL